MKPKVAILGNGYWSEKIQKYIHDYFNVKYIFTSKDNLDIILNDDEIKAVFVITPIDTHYELCKKIIVSKKHVFVEKPITTDYIEARKLIKLANLMGVKLYVDYTEITAPSRIKMKEILPQIGKIEFIEGSCKHLGRFMGQNVFRLLGSHLLSMLSLCLNLKDLDYYLRGNISSNGIITAGSIFGYTKEGKSAVTLDVNLHYPSKEYKFTIYGEKGTIQWDVSKEESLSLTLYEKKFKALPNELTLKEFNWKFDEKNNLTYSIQTFYDILYNNKSSNSEIATQITNIIEGLK